MKSTKALSEYLKDESPFFAAGGVGPSSAQTFVCDRLVVVAEEEEEAKKKEEEEEEEGEEGTAPPTVVQT